MKKTILALIVGFMSTTAYTAGPEAVWAGGAWRVANESSPAYMAEAFVSFGRLDSLRLFSDSMVYIREGEPGVCLGAGARVPIPGRQIIAGYNLFLDVTTNNCHKRLGTGAEIFHPRFSAHVNVYLPVSTQHHGEEAVPGIGLTLGIPVPDAPFITVWTGVYYYGGEIQTDVGGVALALEIKPVKAVSVIAGWRSDALEEGKNDTEIFAGLRITIPTKRTAEDLFRLDRGEYPVSVNTRLEHRVVREPFITFEHKEE